MLARGAYTTQRTTPTVRHNCMTKLKIFITLIFAICAVCTQGQDTTKATKIKEYYLGIADLSPFNISFKYKRQLKNTSFIKIGLVSISGNIREYKPRNSAMFSSTYYRGSLGLIVGLEFRKNITDKFILFHGPNLSLVYNGSMTEVNDSSLPQRQRRTITQTASIGIPYTLGIMFLVTKRFLIAAEINPEVLYSYTSYENRQSAASNYKHYSPSFNFSTEYGLISVAYRIL